MTPERVIIATESGALLVGVYGDLAGTDRKMPRPRSIVSTLIFYGLLGLLAQLGEGVARVAAAAGSVLFLTLLVGAGVRKVAGGTERVGGKGGQALVGLIDTATSLITGG